MKVKEKYVKKTNFRMRYGNYEFLVISFGLTNNPIAFMDMMDRICKLFLDISTILFIEDVLIHSKNQ